MSEIIIKIQVFASDGSGKNLNLLKITFDEILRQLQTGSIKGDFEEFGRCGTWELFGEVTENYL